jgi:hypothetical protein
MVKPELFRNCFKKESRSCRAWADFYQVNESSLRVWLRDLPIKKVFEALERGDRPRERGRKEKIWVDVFGTQKTLADWAKVYGYEKRYLRQKIKQGDIFLELLRPKAKEILDEPIIRKDGQIQLTWQGHSRPAMDWAEYFGVSIHEFYQKKKAHGNNVFKYFSQRKVG